MAEWWGSEARARELGASAVAATCPRVQSPCRPPLLCYQVRLRAPRSPPCSHTHPQATVEDLEEAEGEVMLLDDEEVPYVVGECFVRLPREEAEERLGAGACA